MDSIVHGLCTREEYEIAITVANCLVEPERGQNLQELRVLMVSEGEFRNARRVAWLMRQKLTDDELVSIIDYLWNGYLYDIGRVINRLSEPLRTQKLLAGVAECFEKKEYLSAERAAAYLPEPYRTEELDKVMMIYAVDGDIVRVVKVARLLGRRPTIQELLDTLTGSLINERHNHHEISKLLDKAKRAADAKIANFLKKKMDR